MSSVERRKLKRQAQMRSLPRFEQKRLWLSQQETKKDSRNDDLLRIKDNIALKLNSKTRVLRVPTLVKT